MTNSTPQLEKALQNIGFTSKQAKVYLALWELGPSPAKDISIASGIKKPTTYVILEELKDMAAVDLIPGSKKRVFSAKNPGEVFDAADRRVNEAFADLPLIKKLGKAGSDRSICVQYEGNRGLSQAMKFKEDEVINSKEHLCYFAPQNSVQPGLSPAMQSFFQRIRAEGVKVRGFTSSQSLLDTLRSQDAEFYKDIKILSANMFSADVTIEISHTFVRFTHISQNTITIIDSVEIATAMRQIFEMNWGNMNFFSNMLNKTVR